MKLNNKRGVSGVIVAVLMILIVIAAIVILWAVLQPFISSSLEEGIDTTECIDVSFEMSDVDYANTQGGPESDITFTVTHTSGDTEFDGLKILLDGQEKPVDSESVFGSTEVKGVGESQGYTILDVADASGSEIQYVALKGDNVCGIPATGTVP